MSWSQTTLPLATGDAFHSDPTVEWTSDGTAWSTTLGINSSATQLRLRAYKSTNGGASWTLDATPSGSQTSTDKQMTWVDHSATSAVQGQPLRVLAQRHAAVRQPAHVLRLGTALQISG